MRKTDRVRSLLGLAVMICGLHGVALAQAPTEQEKAEGEKQLNLVMSEMAKGGADPADYRRYRDMMPASLVGLTRTDCSGQNQEAQGMASSVVTCMYGDSGGKVRVRFTDMGNMGQMAAMMEPGLAMKFEIETDDGFERSTKIDGYPGRQSWHEPTNRSELTLRLGDRGLLEVRAFELGSEGAVRAGRALPLGRFAALASHK